MGTQGRGHAHSTRERRGSVITLVSSTDFSSFVVAVALSSTACAALPTSSDDVAIDSCNCSTTRSPDGAAVTPPGADARAGVDVDVAAGEGDARR